MAGYTRRFIIVCRADFAVKGNAAAKANDFDPGGGEKTFNVPLSASGNLPAQTYWMSCAMTTGMAGAIRTRLQAQGATVAETTPIAVGQVPVSTRFAIFDADLWTPDAVLAAVGMQTIGTLP